MATNPTVTVKYRNQPSATINTITVPIQRVGWQVGRQNITDNWSSGSGTIFGRKPDDLFGASRTTGPTIGDPIAVIVSDGSGQNAYFFGAVQDVRIVYGFTTALDTWEILIQGRYGTTGRNITTITTLANTSTLDFADKIATAMTNAETVYSLSGWGSTTSAQTYSSQVSDAVDSLMATEQGAVVEYGQDSGGTLDAYVKLCSRNDPDLYGLAQNVLSDTTSTVYGVTPKKYNAITFLSANQNYSTKVNVAATGLATQSSGSGRQVYSISTINSTTTEAANIAAAVKTQLDANVKTPYTVTFAGSNNSVACSSLGDANQIKKAAVLVFRGTQFNMSIEGLQFDATPEDWECTWTLATGTTQAWFRLDNQMFGVLDTSRLGY